MIRQWTSVDFLRHRFVLNQLHQRRFQHNFTLGRAYIFAHLELIEVGHFDPQFTLAAFEVLEDVFQSINKVFAARTNGFFQNCRIGGDEVRWGERIDKLAGLELSCWPRLS